ncbi:polysaccharide deacetylase family protein [Periweissella cryptocerci]|uniref:polysaccharide deacetylase family protein n=1 Tax=Periweissella cryptocerci TaxID=2506420 RepID=UPI001405362E|nr:polysaccharide deacetylase family protein [Periweissella cryptocerci]
MKKFMIIIGLVLFLVGVLVIELVSAAQQIQQAAKTQPNYSNTKAFRSSENGIVVLCYHRILKQTDTVKMAEQISQDAQLQTFNVPVNEFAHEMRYLKSQHIPVISPSEMLKLVHGGKINRKYVVITFDDIDRTVIENAVPILKRYQFPYTTFIITGQTRQYLNGSEMTPWSELQANYNPSYVTAGLHTNDLHYLRHNKPILADKTQFSTFTQDYRQSQKTLAKMLTGEPAHFFAYPYGYGDQRMSNYLLHHGIRGIFMLNSGIVTAKTNPAKIPRTVVTKDNWASIHGWLARGQHEQN